MATTNVTSPTGAFAPARSSGPFSDWSAQSAAGNKLAQLRSLLMASYGVGQEWLEDIGPIHRDNILWLASDLAEEIDRLMNGGSALEKLEKLEPPK